MLVKKSLLVFFVVITSVLCDDLDSIETSEDCDDHVITIDQDGVSDYESFVTTSVKFYLITPSNDTIELNSSNTHLVKTTKPTKLLIHGLGTYDANSWVDEMAYVYHTHGNYNIIAVDWSKISTKDKVFVVEALDDVGQVVGDYIMDISERSEEYLTDVHLIGSSMGAQIGGAAGETVAKTGTKVGRITGLDPTVPEDAGYLDDGDADFVDVIHTSRVYGDFRIGTVDFYVFADDPDHPVCVNDTCGGLLAGYFFITSIQDADRFKGISCYNSSDFLDDLCQRAHGVVMGEHVGRNLTGSYLVSKDSASGLYPKRTYILSYVATISLWYLLK